MDYSPNSTLTPEEEQRRRQAMVVDALMQQNLTTPPPNGGRFATPTSALNVIAEIGQNVAGEYRKDRLRRPRTPGQTVYDQPIGPQEPTGYIDPFL